MLKLQRIVVKKNIDGELLALDCLFSQPCLTLQYFLVYFLFA